MEKSIYQLICDNITNGVLNDNFSLPDEDSDEESVEWAPGAMDGVYVYHMRHSGLDASQTKGMATALKSAAKGNFPEADRLFFEWTKDNRAVSVVDELQKYVIDHSAKLDAGHVFQTALSMMLHSKHIECVKIGMELMELFQANDEKVKEVIRRLGLYDEFTIFSVWNMQKWENGNDEIFALAKKVHGWGRIHAVERMEPDSDEIRQWLLTEGTVNDVVNAYSALTCWEKSGAENILFGKPTLDEYKGIIMLIDALLDEGPVPGISELEDVEKIMLRILEIAPEYNLSIWEYDMILVIMRWAEDESEISPAVPETCNEILHSQDCIRQVREGIKEGKGIGLAEALGIPFREELLDCMKNDFDNNFYKCSYLMEDAKYIQPTLKVFRENLPLSEMTGEPENNMGLGEEYKPYTQLQFLLQELRNYPLTGTEFIKTGLHSPLSRNRNGALASLKAWVQETKQPLSELSPDLFELVKELRGKEVNDGAMEMIIPLLDGQTTFIDGIDESEDE